MSERPEHPLTTSEPDRHDIGPLSQLIRTSVNDCIVASRVERLDIVESAMRAAKDHVDGKTNGVHLVCRRADDLLGVILIRDFWNLVNLFVLPEAQRCGIATRLVTEALSVCRVRSPRTLLRVNSSTFAAPFYVARGFELNGPARRLPGGCIPYVYRLTDADT